MAVKKRTPKITSLVDFLKNPKTATKFEEMTFFKENGSAYVVADNNVYYYNEFDYTCENINDNINDNARLSIRDDEIVGFYRNKKIYADADGMSVIRPEKGHENLIYFFSFNCLELLVENAIEKIKNNTLIFKDQTSEEKIKINAKDAEKLRKEIKVKPPKLGFTFINLWGDPHWHKSGSILIYDKTDNKSYLLGQDEGQYFGVELPENPKTIAAAHTCLKPQEIRRKNCDRQGEWFLVPVKAKEVPTYKDCLVFGDRITLPVDDNDSNHHDIHGDIRVSKTGVVYACGGSLSHDQHEEIPINNWVKFVKNTAVRSVSVDGVD